jgi:hypothetical protein
MDFTCLPDHTLDQLIALAEQGAAPAAISHDSPASMTPVADDNMRPPLPSVANLERERDRLLARLSDVNAAIAVQRATRTVYALTRQSALLCLT